MQAILISPYIDETGVLQVILQKAGFLARADRSLEQALTGWPENPADLILIVLEGENPKLITQIKSLRAHTVVPIVLISEQIADHLQVAYLESGVDQVMMRPYSVRVLAAQIRSLMRRSGGVPFFSLPNLIQNDIQLDPANRSVQIKDREPQKLTQLEFRLLYTLMTHMGQIFETEQIVAHVWGYAGEGNRELVRGLVQRLRAKIEIDPRNPEYILTEVGIGYYFRK